MPKFKKVSADEFMAQRKDHIRGDSSDAVMVKGFRSPKSWNPDERSAVFVMSTETPDRYKDIVDQGGMDITRFMQNPQGLLFHNSRSWPCGTWSDVTKVLNGRPKRTEGKLTFLPEGVDEDADRAARHVAAGVLRTVSIGFIPNYEEIEWILDDDDEWTGGFRYGASELIECSVVPIPAQPDALVKDAGGDWRLAKDLIEDVLDTYRKTPEGLLLPIAEYEKAYKTVVEKIADDVAPQVAAWSLPAKYMGLFTAEEDAELHALAASDGHDAANAKADEFKAALDAPKVDDEEMATFKAFLAENVKDGDSVYVYHQLVRSLPTPATIEKGVTVQHAGTDKIDKFEFAGEMTAEHKQVVAERLAEIEAEKAATPPENKTETNAAPIVVTLEADTSQVEAAVTKVAGLFGRLAKQFPMFFPKAIEERIEPTLADPEPPAQPTADEIAAARAKAAAVRERLVTKDLIAA